MKLIRLKHEMDKEYRVRPLDDAFMEALNLSSGCSNNVEEFEYYLLGLIKNCKNSQERDMFLSIIKDEYKISVMKGWNYKVDNHIWLEKIVFVESSIDAYPLTVSPKFLEQMVRKIHRDELDFEEGDLLDRIWSYCGYDYVLCELNINDIEYDIFAIDEDLVKDYMDESLEDIPPIILDIPISNDLEPLNKFPLIDGAHRCAKLKQLGLSKIQAYIPMPMNN